MVADAEDVVISVELDGTIASWNHAAERMLGYSTEEAVGEGLALIDEAAGDRLRGLRGGAGAPSQGRYRRKGGGTVEVCVTASPVRDDSGGMLGAAMIVRDATARVRERERQSRQFAEMHHSIRNLFTLAGSVVSLSSRFAATPAEMARRVRGRLVALSHATDLRIAAAAEAGPAAAGDVALHALIRAVLASHVTAAAGDEGGRVTISGADLPIHGGSVNNFALLLDELAGKALRYGALSQARGRVSVATAVEPAGLVFEWREHGGAPPADGVLREGAGSRFIHSIATQHLGGAMTRRWAGDGVAVRLVIPPDRLRP